MRLPDLALNILPEGLLLTLHFILGILFGFILEQAGFGRSNKLAAQFYFKDLTVLKVMFTAIITAMLGLLLLSSFGFIESTSLYINPTYIWSGILGGLVMGAGFIIGGFCPGTSLVSLATGKIDGMFFSFGVLIGIFFFGESVDSYTHFWNSGFYHNLTLPEFFNLNPGVTALLLLLMALFMFKGGELLETKFGKSIQAKLPIWAVAAFVLASILILVKGQESWESHWNRIALAQSQKITKRTIFVSPEELLSTYYGDIAGLVLLDMRSESDWNYLHLFSSQRLPVSLTPTKIRELKALPSPTALVLISNSEEDAIQKWKELTTYGLPNLYILDGGIQNWLNVYHDLHGFPVIDSTSREGKKQYVYAPFPAIGSRHLVSTPPREAITTNFKPHMQLESRKKARSGGCG